MKDDRLCPLCKGARVEFFCRDDFREYWKCSDCRLIHVPARYHLEPRDEKARYDLHQNRIGDEGYVRHLMEMVEPLATRVPVGARGLDFGSGPVPVLAQLLEKRGFEMSLYDHFYASEEEALKRKYDFLVSVETVEHFVDPAKEFSRFNDVVVPGGLIAVMTQMAADESGFAKWHYRSDPTHICFFSKATFEWMAKKFGWALELCDRNVVMLGKGRET